MRKTSRSEGGVVVISGAASGMGLAAVRAMRETGAAIVAVDLAEKPPALANEAHIKWVRGDISEQATWDRANAAVTRGDREGARALIACAAALMVKPFAQTAPEDWTRLLETNVVSIVKAFHTLLPAMVKRGSGAAAVVCSVNSLFVEEPLSAYSTSKAALLHAVRSAALEYARHGIRINAVCPGAVDTPMLQRHLDNLDDPAAARRAIEKRTPAGRLIQPEEIASVLRFLVSPESSGMSGATVVVDGGLTTAYDFAL